MNPSFPYSLQPIAVLLTACAVLAACSASPTRPPGADDARGKLTQLQSDAQLASRAPVAIKEAEVAVAAAEVPRQDGALGHHLVVMADRKVDIAAAQAQSRLLEDQRKTLSEQRESARLDARTREADQARGEVRSARAEASAARSDGDSARQQAEELQRQLALLSARETDRGQVITLGDVLFATGKSELRGSAVGNLGKLAQFLNRYEDRSVTIEGYTDSVGSEDFNMALSQRRADSVKTYLVKQGVAASRLHSSGMGMSAPVSDNATATGRQQNRRVEVIISNPATPAG